MHICRPQSEQQAQSDNCCFSKTLTIKPSTSRTYASTLPTERYIKSKKFYFPQNNATTRHKITLTTNKKVSITKLRSKQKIKQEVLLDYQTKLNRSYKKQNIPIQINNKQQQSNPFNKKSHTATSTKQSNMIRQYANSQQQLGSGQNYRINLDQKILKPYHQHLNKDNINLMSFNPNYGIHNIQYYSNSSYHNIQKISAIVSPRHIDNFRSSSKISLKYINESLKQSMSQIKNVKLIESLGICSKKSDSQMGSLEYAEPQLQKKANTILSINEDSMNDSTYTFLNKKHHNLETNKVQESVIIVNFFNPPKVIQDRIQEDLKKRK